MIDILPAILEYGWNIGLVAALAVVIVRAWKQNDKLEGRIQSLEEEFRTQLSKVLSSAEVSMRLSTEQVVLSRQVIETFLLKSR